MPESGNHSMINDKSIAVLKSGSLSLNFKKTHKTPKKQRASEVTSVSFFDKVMDLPVEQSDDDAESVDSVVRRLRNRP